jgi:hypothetical protein
LRYRLHRKSGIGGSGDRNWVKKLELGDSRWRDGNQKEKQVGLFGIRRMCRLQWRYENQKKRIRRWDIRETGRRFIPQMSIGMARNYGAISQHLSVSYGTRNRVRRIRWWGVENCKELLEHRRGRRIIIPIQIRERWNLRETADGDFVDLSWLRKDINAGWLVISVGAIFGAKSHQRVSADRSLCNDGYCLKKRCERSSDLQRAQFCMSDSEEFLFYCPSVCIPVSSYRPIFSRVRLCCGCAISFMMKRIKFDFQIYETKKFKEMEYDQQNMAIKFACLTLKSWNSFLNDFITDWTIKNESKSKSNLRVMIVVRGCRTEFVTIFQNDR